MPGGCFHAVLQLYSANASFRSPSSRRRDGEVAGEHVPKRQHRLGERNGADVRSIESGDVWEVIEAAATKPFGFMPFQPGPGLGGHCIPIDPHYLPGSSKL